MRFQFATLDEIPTSLRGKAKVTNDGLYLIDPQEMESGAVRDLVVAAVGGTGKVPDGTGAITITREQARDFGFYQRQRAKAEAEGVPLRVVDKEVANP